MFSYLLRRFALAGLMLFGLICLTFTIANIAPADPAVLAAGPDAGRSQIEQARREYGLDKPLPEQFLRYVSDLAHGEFGRSVASGRSVGRDLARYFPATLELCLLAMTIGLVFGISLGMLSALFKDRSRRWRVAVAAGDSARAQERHAADAGHHRLALGLDDEQHRAGGNGLRLAGHRPLRRLVGNRRRFQAGHGRDPDRRPELHAGEP